MGQLLMNSSADLDRSYEAVASFGKSDPVPGNVLGKGSTFLVFGNVDPGPVEVEVTTPDGETCIGRTSVEVPPDVLTQVSYRCE